MQLSFCCNSDTRANSSAAFYARKDLMTKPYHLQRHESMSTASIAVTHRSRSKNESMQVRRLTNNLLNSQSVQRLSNPHFSSHSQLPFSNSLHQEHSFLDGSSLTLERQVQQSDYQQTPKASIDLQAKLQYHLEQLKRSHLTSEYNSNNNYESANSNKPFNQNKLKNPNSHRESQVLYQQKGSFSYLSNSNSASVSPKQQQGRVTDQNVSQFKIKVQGSHRIQHAQSLGKLMSPVQKINTNCKRQSYVDVLSNKKDYKQKRVSIDLTKNQLHKQSTQSTMATPHANAQSSSTKDRVFEFDVIEEALNEHLCETERNDKLTKMGQCTFEYVIEDMQQREKMKKGVCLDRESSESGFYDSEQDAI